jgi:hypothetical protein
VSAPVRIFRPRVAYDMMTDDDGANPPPRGPKETASEKDDDELVDGLMKRWIVGKRT